MNYDLASWHKQKIREAAPSLTRARADLLLSRALVRVHEINRRPAQYFHRIDSFAVFGSYLADVPMLGDLDLAARFIYLPDTRSEGDFVHHWRRGLSRCVAYLRQRCRLVNVHAMEELVSLKYPHRVLFEASGPSR